MFRHKVFDLGIFHMLASLACRWANWTCVHGNEYGNGNIWVYLCPCGQAKKSRSGECEKTKQEETIYGDEKWYTLYRY